MITKVYKKKKEIKNMVNPILLNYIREALDKEIEPSSIIEKLQKNGYDAKKITEIVLNIKKNYDLEKKLPEPKLTLKYRNPLLVLGLSIITFGIYLIYWIIATSNNLREKTNIAPNPYFLLLLLIPYFGIIAYLYYFWKYSESIEKLSGYKAWVLFIFWVFVTPLGIIISQRELNKISK
jgi:hypothetical protein